MAVVALLSLNRADMVGAGRVAPLEGEEGRGCASDCQKAKGHSHKRGGGGGSWLR